MTKEKAAWPTPRRQRKIKVCMFDQYGTVVDMQTGSGGRVTSQGQRWKGNAYEFVTGASHAFENSMIDALLHRSTCLPRDRHLSVRHVLTRARIKHTEEECAGSSPPSSG